MNLNQLAIESLENNEYDQAFAYFQEAVKVSRDIQSLNNLAWMYYFEEGEDEKAIELLKEALRFEPTSYFPYNLLGQIYTKQEKWNLADDVLQKAILLHPSNEALQNLAIAKYHLGDLEEAAELFQQVAGDSDYNLYSYVYCLIRLNRLAEAKELLDTFNAEADDFAGELCVADLYLEIHCYEEAVEWFERGWDGYYKYPEWISCFVYALYKIDNINRLDEVLSEAIRIKVEEINEAHEDEINDDWTIQDYEEHLQILEQEKLEYETIKQKIDSGYVPEIRFVTALASACYLFGCGRHGYLEYDEWVVE